MNAWRPTRAEQRKYADYAVAVRSDSTYPVHIEIQDGKVSRFYAIFNRIPSRKLFIVRMKQGATEHERELAAEDLEMMPFGEWARFPDQWTRRRQLDDDGIWRGRLCFSQTRGHPAPDPFLQLELEMMIDAGRNPCVTPEDRADAGRLQDFGRSI